MKKLKFLLPILTAILLLFPGMNAAAKETTIQLPKQKFASGTTNATVTMTLEDLQSFDGDLRVKSVPTGAELTILSVEAECDNALCMTSGTKIFMVSSGEPVTTTVTAELQFSKDETYVIELSGNATDEDGDYDKYSATMEIQVGESTQTGTGNQNQNSDGNIDIDSNFEMNINVNYEPLVEALEEVAEAIDSDEQLKAMEDLLNQMNEAITLLSSDDQEAVDEAAIELQESLEELELVPVTEVEADETMEEIAVEEEKNEETGKKGIEKLPIILILIVLALAGIAVALWLLKKAKDKPADYDGAPMVEYDIEDDDEE